MRAVQSVLREREVALEKHGPPAGILMRATFRLIAEECLAAYERVDGMDELLSGVGFGHVTEDPNSAGIPQKGLGIMHGEEQHQGIQVH
jgi:hypothetical protein